MEAVSKLRAGPSELTARRRPLKALTGIRFFAAFYVVIFHSRVGATLFEHGHHAAGNFFLSGYLAVPLFFLLSGFILAYTYEGQINRRGDHRRFWEARFARIWPVYAFSLLLALILAFRFPPPGQALAVLGMVQAWNPFDIGMAGAWNMVCWTLSVEAVFYIVFPWVQRWVEERGIEAQLGMIAGMLLLCVALNSTSRVLGYKAQGLWRWIPLPLPHLPEFLTGVALGNYFLRRLTLKPGGNMGAGLWTYGGAALTAAILCLPAGRWTSAVVIGFAALLYGLAAEKTLLARFLSTKAMLLGGEISYSVYLIQIPLKSWIKMAFDRMHAGSEVVRLGVTAVALIVVSLILYKTVEVPARKLIRSVFAKLEVRRERALETV